MALRPTPLAIAVSAAALLVVVVAVDVAVSRTYELQVNEDGQWRTLATSRSYDERDPFLRQSVTAEANDTLLFRLVADNGWPTGLDERYEVRHLGTVIDDGRLTAPARGTGAVEFEVDVRTATNDGEPKVLRPGFGSIEVVIDGNYLWAEIIIEEGSA